jgi:TolB-like protein
MRKLIRLTLPVAAAFLAASSLPAAETPKPEELVVVIFPFTSPDGGANGRAFAEALGLRAKRLGLVTVEHLSLTEAMAGAAMPKLDTPAAEMAKILKDRFGARFGLWGEVRQEGDGVVMEIRALDAEKDPGKLAIAKTYQAAQKQLVNPVQDQVLMELTGRRKKPVAEATPEADAKVPTKGPELARNGGFEEGDKSPTGWQRIDGLTTFWPGAGQTGNGLKIVTDVYHDQWVEWQKKYKAGASAAEAPKAAPTAGAKYDTVAGLYGVAFDSDPIPVRPGKAYKVSVSYKGKSDDFFFPKLFIRGWGDVGGEKREVYDAYLALRCKTAGKEWESNVRIVEIPTDTKAPVEYVKLKLYAYWPPVTFFFDNVSMKEVAK